MFRYAKAMVVHSLSIPRDVHLHGSRTKVRMLPRSKQFQNCRGQPRLGLVIARRGMPQSFVCQSFDKEAPFVLPDVVILEFTRTEESAGPVQSAGGEGE